MSKIENYLSEKFNDLLNQIRDQALRTKVIATWIEAIELGGWKVEELDEVPFTISIKNHQTDINILDHTVAVTKATLAMARAEKETYGHKEDYLPVNEDYLIAGGLLHDVGKVIEYTKKDGQFVQSLKGKALRHPGYGAAIAYKQGVPDEILNTIANHSSEGDGRPRTKEAWLVLHCDFAFFEALIHPFHE